MTEQHLFKWRHFQPDIILLSVRWYLRYALSYRDLEEMMAERGLSIDHSTISRWVHVSAPELDKRCRPHLKAWNDSWRVGETYVGIGPEKWILETWRSTPLRLMCSLESKWTDILVDEGI